MSNQAEADLTDVPHYDAGQAGAGADFGGDWEGRESDPSSANHHADLGDVSSAGSGREEGADVLDETQNDIDSYWKTVAELDLESMPLDVGDDIPQGETGAEAPVADQGEPAEAETQTVEDDDAGEQQGARKKQFRLRPRDELDEKAFALMAADPGLSGESAFAMARIALGLPATAPGEPAAPAATTEEPAAAEPAGESVATLEARIRELREKVIDASEAYDLETVGQLNRELLAIEADLPLARQREAEAQRAAAEATAAWDRAAAASWEAVQAQYPDAADPKSAFCQRMADIDEAAGEAAEFGDAKAKDLYNNPDKARLIAAIVAKELGLKPGASKAPAPAPLKGRTPPAPVSSRTSAPASRPGPVVVRPASGSARTAADTPTQFEVALSRAQTPEEYDALVASGGW